MQHFFITKQPYTMYTGIPSLKTCNPMLENKLTFY